MLRLDPAYPPLWRSTTTLQFGADAVAVLEDPKPWQQRLIRELEHGIPDAAVEPIAVAFGAPERGAEAFLRRVAPALIAREPSPRPVWLQTPEGFPRDDARRVAQALESTGLHVTELTWFGMADQTIPDAAPVVVLAHHVIEPRRAAALMGRDVPHLPLVLTGAAAEVGPYVVPGRTPCLACLAAHRCDADPHWPAIAAQLLGRRAPEVRDALAAEAAFVAARMISAAEQDRRVRSYSLTLREDSLHRETRVHSPHAACRCLSLEESAKAAVPLFPATTTSTAFAQPA